MFPGFCCLLAPEPSEDFGWEERYCVHISSTNGPLLAASSMKLCHRWWKSLYFLHLASNKSRALETFLKSTSSSSNLALQASGFVDLDSVVAVVAACSRARRRAYSLSSPLMVALRAPTSASSLVKRVCRSCVPERSCSAQWP